MVSFICQILLLFLVLLRSQSQAECSPNKTHIEDLSRIEVIITHLLGEIVTIHIPPETKIAAVY